MLLVNVSGAANSGKTTLIRECVKRLHADGKKAAVILNQQGLVDIDPEFKGRYQVAVRQIRGG